MKINWPLYKSYLAVCKLKVIMLMLITSVVGMLLTPSHYQLTFSVLFWGNLGIACAAASAAAINHVLDRHIDEKMQRTHKRPLPNGDLKPKQVIYFALGLCVLSMSILYSFINTLTATLTFLSLIGYAFIYTAFLKRQTPQNIVIGGATGAAPPLLGWVAVTNHVAPEAWLLMLIIFVWTPPHFWSLAIHRYNDYLKIDLPMLPTTHGIPFTKINITLYTILLTLVTLLPYCLRMSGDLYLSIAIILNAIFLYYTLSLQFNPKPNTAIKTFKYSCLYLLLLFLGLLLDHIWTMH